MRGTDGPCTSASSRPTRSLGLAANATARFTAPARNGFQQTALLLQVVLRCSERKPTCRRGLADASLARRDCYDVFHSRYSKLAHSGALPCSKCAPQRARHERWQRGRKLSQESGVQLCCQMRHLASPDALFCRPFHNVIAQVGFYAGLVHVVPGRWSKGGRTWAGTAS